MISPETRARCRVPEGGRLHDPRHTGNTLAAAAGRACVRRTLREAGDGKTRRQAGPTAVYRRPGRERWLATVLESDPQKGGFRDEPGGRLHDRGAHDPRPAGTG
ncbi:hypothetical protein GCM10007977_087350 [Dactylosporangium sucinum]|uniref:Uncharacterized protein n=1 Tax=Dactylosporangium sucinum TaxID=1424081 RepID=A0A917X5L8_9ACTN|nr:hypothetical protein GCM10007977_087350 [Dactylosporangium sucinum]